MLKWVQQRPFKITLGTEHGRLIKEPALSFPFHKPTIEHQRRLNPNMKEVVRAEVLKLLDAGIIYPISNSKWVSPVQVIPKNGGITVIHNENNELIPTRTVMG